MCFICKYVAVLYGYRYVSLLQVYAELLEENGIRIPAWFSFTSKDGVNAASGDPINECAAVADSCPRVAAVGVNCTAPRFIHGLILSIKKVRHSRSLLRGETNTSIIWNSWQLNLFPGDEQADRRVSEQRGVVRRGDERMGGALAFVTN
jgi:S-methylmethionine-dependent homocysteine/selenocysteine methylase